MQAKEKGAVSALAAVASVLLASSCCIPIAPFIAAAGLAGGSAFLNAARPWLLGASALFIGFGFWQARRARQCARKPAVLPFALLWVSTAFVGASVLFPQTMANAAANLLARPAPESVGELPQAFNRAKEAVRVVVLLSPT
jgi:O-antigen ligase